MSKVVIQRTSRILVDITALGTTSLDSIYMRGVDPSKITLRTKAYDNIPCGDCALFGKVLVLNTNGLPIPSGS